MFAKVRVELLWEQILKATWDTYRFPETHRNLENVLLSNEDINGKSLFELFCVLIAY